MTHKIRFAIVLALDIASALSARQAFNQDSAFFMALSVITLTLAGYFFIQLMKGRVGMIVNITWVALGTMNVTLASYLVFGETVTAVQGLGMVLIVAGIILTEFFGNSDSKKTEPQKRLAKAQEKIMIPDYESLRSEALSYRVSATFNLRKADRTVQKPLRAFYK